MHFNHNFMMHYYEQTSPKTLKASFFVIILIYDFSFTNQVAKTPFNCFNLIVLNCSIDCFHCVNLNSICSPNYFLLLVAYFQVIIHKKISEKSVTSFKVVVVDCIHGVIVALDQFLLRIKIIPSLWVF